MKRVSFFLMMLLVIYSKQLIAQISNNQITPTTNLQICSGTQPGQVQGSTPSGGLGSYQYLWLQSNINGTTGFTNAIGVDTLIDYTPPILNVNTWYKRVVINNGFYDTSSALAFIVSPMPTIFAGNDTIVAAGSSVMLSATSSTGTPIIWENMLPNNQIVNPTYNHIYIASSTIGDCVAYDSIIVFVNTLNSLNYCSVISNSPACSGNYINSFSTTGGISNIVNMNTGCNNPNTGYELVNKVCAATNTSLVSFSIENSATQQQGFKIWVDWNQDGMFSQFETVFTSFPLVPPGGIVTGNISIPLTAIPGFTIMRVRSQYANLYFSPCGGLNFGEVEDYYFNTSPVCSAYINIDTQIVCTNTLPIVWNGITCNQSGTFIYHPITSSFCDSILYLHLLTNPQPIVDAGNDTTICLGKSVVFNASGNANSYLWSNSSIVNGIAYYPLASDVYWVTGTNSYGCEKTDSILVNVVPQPIPGSIIASNISGNLFQFSSTGIFNVQSYVWYFGDGDTSIQLSPIHHYNWAGNYTAMLVATNTVNGCSDTASTQVSITTSVEALPHESSFSLTPNPFKESLQLTTQQSMGSITIYDAQGKKIKQQTIKTTTTNMDLKGIPSGVYLVEYDNGNKKESRKVVKE